jgi:hypothetical protein
MDETKVVEIEHDLVTLRRFQKARSDSEFTVFCKRHIANVKALLDRVCEQQEDIESLTIDMVDKIRKAEIQVNPAAVVSSPFELYLTR